MCQALLKSFSVLLIYPMAFRLLWNRMATSRCLAQTRYVSFKCLGLEDSALAKIFRSRILTMLWFLQTVVRVKGRPIWSKYNSKPISGVKWFCQEYGQTATNCYLCRPLPPICPDTMVIMIPWLHMNLFCALSQVKQDDTMSFSSLVHELQHNMTHTLIRTLLQMICVLEGT